MAGVIYCRARRGARGLPRPADLQGCIGKATSVPIRIWLVILLLVLTPAPARPSAEPGFIVRILPSGEDIAISGPITEGLGAAFRDALAKAPKARLVRLESGGGTLDVAIDLYAAIRSHGMETAVQGQCESACTIAYMAGQRRYYAPRARLGFHRASGAEFKEFPLADFIVRGLYVQSGMAEWFADRVMETPHENMWRPGEADLRRGGVVTDVGIPQ